MKPPSLASGVASLKVAPLVFFPAAVVTLAVVLFSLAAPHQAEVLFGGTTDWIVGRLGWFFQVVVTAQLGLVLWLPWGERGRRRLGKTDPEFSRLSWFSMLFAAGMGIGLLFFGVFEPLTHEQSPPYGEGGTPSAARTAMGLTFFHWGVHAWAVYVVLALALCHFSYNRGLPLSVRSTLYPLLGRRIFGPWGDAVDFLAVFGTIFGLATSLGLGAQQITAGLRFLFAVPDDITSQLWVIAGITLAATLSLLSGVGRGIRRLSELTLLLASGLWLFVLVFGERSGGALRVWEDLRAYASQVYFATTFSPQAGDEQFQSSWTVFYWAWWIAWAPFVATFIARVSRGRTVREFVLGVMLVPTGLTLAWLFVFGETALHYEATYSQVISKTIGDDPSLSLYALLLQLPFSAVTCGLGCLTVALFFVTSSDSGSFVVDILTSGGQPNPPIAQRVFWATLEGVVASVLLWGGGLAALQSAAIATGLPFALILLCVGYGLVRDLRASRLDGAPSHR